MPFGLIINELITNANIHAFPDDSEVKVNIKLYQNSKNEIILEFSDNGIGFSKNFNIDDTQGLGLKLVKNIISSQMNGDITFENRNGLFCQITIKDELYQPRV